MKEVRNTAKTKNKRKEKIQINSITSTKNAQHTSKGKWMGILSYSSKLQS